MTKVFEEASPLLKEICQHLNTLNLVKQQPKTKDQTKKHAQVCSTLFKATMEDLGGKAGTSHFLVNVGEIHNLHKSSKTPHGPSTSSIIDLHGCSQEEAISRLNAGLKDCNEQAMLGSYPFIHSVEIVYGAGGQILSEMVERWIRSKPNVSNAPKKTTRRRFGAVA